MGTDKFVETVDKRGRWKYPSAMAEFLTTSEIARLYGLADSTIRHYRASGRLLPSRRTPGGHARYDVADVVSALGKPGGERAHLTDPGHEARITGLVRESFAAPGEHDLRSSGRGGMLASEAVALGLRETHEPVTSALGRARWGGRLITPRGRVAA